MGTERPREDPMELAQGPSVLVGLAVRLVDRCPPSPDLRQRGHTEDETTDGSAKCVRAQVGETSPGRAPHRRAMTYVHAGVDTRGRSQ